MTDTEIDERGLERPVRPDGSISGLLWEMDCRFVAVKTHATFEGHDVNPRAVSEGYDRALHPWMRGWRYGEIGDTIRTWWNRQRDRLRGELA